MVCPFMPCVCLEIVLVSCHKASLFSSVVCGIQGDLGFDDFLGYRIGHCDS